MSNDDRYRGTGWAWGTTSEAREWLTIASSALAPARLAERPEDAAPPAPIIGSSQELARVERIGTWFRVLEFAPDAEQHRLIAAPRSPLRDTVTGWCTCSTWSYNGRHSVFETGWRFEREASRAEVEAAYAREHAAR